MRVAGQARHASLAASTLQRTLDHGPSPATSCGTDQALPSETAAVPSDGAKPAVPETGRVTSPRRPRPCLTGSTGRGCALPVPSHDPVPTQAPPAPERRESLVRRLAPLAVLFAIYFAAGKLGLSLAVVNPSASAVWPPTGIAIGALLVMGLEVWPAIFVGALAVNLTIQGDWPSSLGIALGNSLE